VLGRLLSSALPIVPRPIVARVARRYIAGDTLDSAVALVQALNKRGWVATVDLLGEDIIEADQSEMATHRVTEVMEALHANDCQAGVSIKLTQLGIRFDDALCARNVQTILEHAKRCNRFVRIDMEDSSLTSQTINAYKHARKNVPNQRIGTVLQAYLYRTQNDINALLESDVLPDLRICKGIYREPPEHAYTVRSLVTRNFIHCVKTLLAAGAKTAIATHDIVIINALQEYIETHRIDRSLYEFQALLGVPIERTLQRLSDAGHRVRIYVPFGAQWYAYSSRRLRENPEIASHVFKAMFRRID